MARLNIPVKIIVSDPWEFGTRHGTGPFAGTIILLDLDPNKPTKKTAALVKLDKPFEFEGALCEYLVAQTRLKKDSINAICKGITVDCNLTAISPDRATSPNPLDLSWWRGGVGLIASITKDS